MLRIPAEEELERRKRVLETSRIHEDLEGTREKCKRLRGFIRESWHVLEPNTPYIRGWHHDAIAEHLEAITNRQITRLQINVPPGSMKSMIASVMWEGWEWGPAGQPWLRYLTTSYKEAYARRDSRKQRDLILSEWYQALWPGVQLIRDNEADFENTARGGRRAMPFASLTAGRGNRVIIDDPHSTETVESDSERETAVRIFRESVTSRLNDPVHDAIMVIMHRLHPEDVCGQIEKLDLDYVKLVLPMEFEEKTFISNEFYNDPRTIDGELLSPDRIPREVVEKNKKELGSHAYATQFQQQASARAGGLFKRHWWKFAKAAPVEAKRKVRRWDLAGTKPEQGSNPDWTVGLLMSEYGGIYYIEDVIRFRDTAMKVRQAISQTAEFDGKHVRIRIPQDPAQAGKDQAESIIRENAGWIIQSERETGEKMTRGEPLAAQVEAGNVVIILGPWNEAFIDEMAAAPQGKMDQFDCAAGAFNYLASKKTFSISDTLLAESRVKPRPVRAHF